MGWYDQMLQAARNITMRAAPVGRITAANLAGLDTLAAQVRNAIRSQCSITRAIDLVTAWTRTEPAH